MSRLAVAALTCLLVLLFPGSAGAEAESRVALVIGNAAYQHVSKLVNPASDARAMTETLGKLGFDVVSLIDGDRAGMIRALGEVRRKMRANGVALLYYAGHGIQVRGRNYLIPVDADIAAENDTPLVAIDLETFEQEMEYAGVRLSLFILDACRDNPFERRFRSAGSRGLAPIDAGRGTLIAFATAPGKTAADGAGDHGLYTTELLKAITKPGLSLEQVLKATAEGVERASGNQQTPWYNSAFHGEFYFTGPINVTVMPPPDKEVIFWTSIKDSRETGDFEAYLKQFPDGTFAPLARSRLVILKALPVAPPPAPVAVTPPPRGEGEESWTLEQRREVQRALRALGHYQGEADGGFGTGTRAAIRDFQSYHGDSETGTLSETERRDLVEIAQRLAVLLDQPTSSPGGVSANTIKGVPARYARASSAETGKGVKQDLAEAAYWYALAGSEGDANALTNLATLLARGQGFSAADPVGAALLWRAAAARGDAVAMFNLGALYERGIGVTADLKQARTWYGRAAAHSHTDARAALKRLGS